MNNIVMVVVLLLVLAGSAPAAAQSDVPQWAVDLKAQMDRIEAKLDSGVVLATQQGQVVFTCNVSHGACWTVRNYAEDGYGASLWGGAVGLHTEGKVGQWDVGDTGFVAEGNTYYGAQFIGPKAGLFAQSWSGYGIETRGYIGPVWPDWRKNAR